MQVEGIVRQRKTPLNKNNKWEIAATHTHLNIWTVLSSKNWSWWWWRWWLSAHIKIYDEILKNRTEQTKQPPPGIDNGIGRVNIVGNGKCMHLYLVCVFNVCLYVILNIFMLKKSYFFNVVSALLHLYFPYIQFTFVVRSRFCILQQQE